MDIIEILKKDDKLIVNWCLPEIPHVEIVPDYNLRHFLSEGIKNCFEREKKWTYNLFFANKN